MFKNCYKKNSVYSAISSLLNTFFFKFFILLCIIIYKYFIHNIYLTHSLNTTHFCPRKSWLLVNTTSDKFHIATKKLALSKIRLMTK